MAALTSSGALFCDSVRSAICFLSDVTVRLAVSERPQSFAACRVACSQSLRSAALMATRGSSSTITGLVADADPTATFTV